VSNFDPEKKNRIFFKDNPFPKGHQIEEFVWSAHYVNNSGDKEEGLYFDIHLATDEYGSEDGYEEAENFEPDSDWHSKTVWENYGDCIISSTEWHYGGFMAADKNNPIDLQNLEGKIFYVDAPPIDMESDYEERAFHIYLLGHDACADHKISFKKKTSDRTYNIEWHGKIALAYMGSYDLDHEFGLYIENVKFDGIYLNDDVPLEQSIEKLASCIQNFKDFHIREIIKGNGAKSYKLTFI